MSNVLSRNDLFANALTCIDDMGSIPVWMFSEHSKTILADPDSERSWTVAMLKAALGKHRTSAQAKELVAAPAPNREAQRLWAASVNVSRGRDSRCLLHAHGTDPSGLLPAVTDRQHRLQAHPARHGHTRALLRTPSSTEHQTSDRRSDARPARVGRIL